MQIDYKEVLNCVDKVLLCYTEEKLIDFFLCNDVGDLEVNINSMLRNFEQKEEYEMCQRIMNAKNKLLNNFSK